MKYLIFLVLLMCSSITGICQVQFLNTAGKTVDLENTQKQTNGNILVYTSTKELPHEALSLGMLLVKIFDRDQAILKAKEYASRAGGDAILMYRLEDGGSHRMPMTLERSTANFAFYVYKVKNTKQ